MIKIQALFVCLYNPYFLAYFLTGTVFFVSQQISSAGPRILRALWRTRHDGPSKPRIKSYNV
jgi:threonine/homoserine/homoserine lactone efflux protein